MLSSRHKAALLLALVIVFIIMNKAHATDFESSDNQQSLQARDSGISTKLLHMRRILKSLFSEWNSGESDLKGKQSPQCLTLFSSISSNPISRRYNRLRKHHLLLFKLTSAVAFEVNVSTRLSNDPRPIIIIRDNQRSRARERHHETLRETSCLKY